MYIIHLKIIFQQPCVVGRHEIVIVVQIHHMQKEVLWVDNRLKVQEIQSFEKDLKKKIERGVKVLKRLTSGACHEEEIGD